MNHKYTQLARAFIFLAIMISLHVFLREIYFEKHPDCSDVSADFRKYLEDSELPDVLLVGNSHVRYGFKAEANPKVQSVAVIGESYIATYYKLKLLLERRGAPRKAVLLQLDLHSFAPTPLEILKNPNSAPYIDHADLASVCGHVPETFLSWLQLSAFPYAGKGPGLSESLALGNADITREAHKSLKRQFSNEAQSDYQAWQVARAHLPDSGLWRHESEVNYFNRIARLCREHGLTLVWVRFPASEQYHSQLTQRLPLAEWQAQVESLLKQNQNVILLDYHDFFFGRNEFFVDPNHLNEAGATLFTDLICRLLVGRGLLSQ